MKYGMILEDYKQNGKLNIEKLVNEYSGYVYTIINNIVNQNLTNEDIEEIISDAFFVIWKNESNLDITTRVGPYLAGITRNLIKQKYRKSKINFDLEDYENVLTDNTDTYEIIEKQGRINAIEKSLYNLGQEDIQIFKMYYYSDLKIKDIAKKLNITEFKVKTRLYRMRKKIKKDLEEGGYSDE